MWCPDLGQSDADGRWIEAGGPHTATEEWARWHDYSSAEYSIVGGKVYEVIVRDEDGNEGRYAVEGESVPHYRTRAVWQ